VNDLVLLGIALDAARPRYFLTEPGVGYRLQAE